MGEPYIYNGTNWVSLVANTGNLTVTNLTVTGVGTFANGSAAAPSITFTSDLDTGFYRAAANTIGFATNGVTALTIDGGQDAVFTSDVTIQGNLNVNGTTSTINSANLAITDNTITLNNGEVGAGVTLGSAGLVVDRGSLTDATLIWNEVLDRWEIGIIGTTFQIWHQGNDGAGSGLDADLLDGVSAAGFLQVANNLSDVANVVTARTNLGLVAGGAGDIWVEKAGDAMTGNLVMTGTARVRLADGTVGSPGVQFDADPTTGIRRSGSGTMVMVNSGVDTVTVRPSGGGGASVVIATSDALQLPSGITTARPATPVNGMIRYNSTLSTFEGYQAGSWSTLGTNYVAGDGITISGPTIAFSNNGLTPTTSIVGTDTVPFFDASNAFAPASQTWSGILTDLSIITTTNLSTAVTAGRGINITGSTISFTNNLMVGTITVLGTDTVPFFDASNGNQAEFRTWNNIIADLSIITTGNLATAVTAGRGIGITGSTINFTNNLMVDTATLATDTVPFFSGGTTPQFRSFANIIADRNIRTGTVAVANGGTGLTAIPAFSVLVANAANTLTTLTAIDAGGNQIIQWNDTSNTFEFITTASISGSNSFGTITTAGNTTGDTSIVSDTPGDTLNLTAGDGITIAGVAATDTLTVSFSRAGLADVGSVLAADTVPYFDASNANAPEFRSWGNILSDLSILTVANFTASMTAGRGISITGTGPTTIAFTNNLMVGTNVVLLADTVPYFRSAAANQAEFRSWTNILADLNIVTAAANGILTRTAANTYASRTITASATAGQEGVVITNGNGVAGNPTVGLDINGLTTDATLVGTDTFPYFNGTNNRKIGVTALASQLAVAGNGVQVLEGSFALVNNTIIGSIPNNGRILRVRVYIDTAYDNLANIQVNMVTGGDIMDQVDIDAQVVGTYESSINYRNTTGAAENLRIQVVTGVPTVGAGRIIVEYYNNSAI